MSRTYVAVNWQNRSWTAEWSYGTQTRLLCPRCDWRCWTFELDDPPTFCPRCRAPLRSERRRHQRRKGGFATVADAKAYLLETFPYEADRIAAIDDDKTPRPPRHRRASEPQPDRGPLVGAVLEDWLEVHRTQVQHSTWRSYEQAVRCYLVPGLHGVYVRELTPAMLTKLYAQLLERGGLRGKPLSIRTVQRIHHILRRALDQLVDDEVIDRNPAAKATVPRRDPRTGADPTVRELRTWTAAQVRVFLASTVGHEYADVWRLAMGTGMRRGELLGLRWEDVDRDGRRLVVRKSLTVIDGRPELKTTKSSRPRIVTLDETTWQAIEHRDADRPPRNPLDLVFTDAAGDPILPDRVTRSWRKLMTELPLPRLRLHDLRHTHATLLLAEGVPVKVVSERLGHASVQITLDVYAHVLPSMDADAAATFGALLGPAATEADRVGVEAHVAR